MSRYNKHPFARGKSAYQNQNTADWDITSLAHLEGQKVYLSNTAPATPTARRNGIDVVAVVVRNNSGALLTPGTALWWKTGYHGTRVDASAATDNSPICGFVDDHVVSTGVQDNDLFYMIIEGPCLVRTHDSGTVHAGSSYVEGGLLVASTSAGEVHAHAVTADADGADADTVWNCVARVIDTTLKTIASGNCLATVKIPL